MQRGNEVQPGLPVGVLIMGDLGIFAFLIVFVWYIFTIAAMMMMMRNTREQANPDTINGHVCSGSSDGKRQKSYYSLSEKYKHRGTERVESHLTVWADRGLLIYNCTLNVARRIPPVHNNLLRIGTPFKKSKTGTELLDRSVIQHNNNKKTWL